MLEPAALGKPVMVGPHTFNFSDILQQLLEVRGALQIQDAQELEDRRFAVCLVSRNSATGWAMPGWIWSTAARVRCSAPWT